VPAGNAPIGESSTVPIVSAAFWLCLFAAAGLYAAVALAPKFHTYLELKQQHRAGQMELVKLEQQVHYLQKVVNALETEPAFSAELARIDFDASRPGDERIPVDPSLRLDDRSRETEPPLPLPVSRWYEPFLDPLARNTRLRGGLLAIAAVLVIGAFTFLQESQTPAAVRSADGVLRRCLRALADRYRKPSV
jgi:cell division protein FtsB